MDYNNLSEDVKTKMFDIHLKETFQSPYQEQYRYFIGRDFWIKHNQDKLGQYYKIVNKLARKEKLNKIRNGIKRRKGIITLGD